MGLEFDTWSAEGTLEGFSAANGYYDGNDHLVAYANGSYSGEYGVINHPITAGSAGPWNDIPLWDNGTQYNVYTDTGERMLPEQQTIEFNLASSLGLIAIVAGGIVLAGFIGTRILGSTAGGGNDESASAIWKGTVLLTIWGIFSVTALGMITQVPYLGPFFYMFLTVIYCLGVINQVGHPGED